MTAPSAKELIARLPRTFGPAINEKIQVSESAVSLLNSGSYGAVDLACQVPGPDFDRLFAPVNDIERPNGIAEVASGRRLAVHRRLGHHRRGPLLPAVAPEVEKASPESMKASKRHTPLPSYSRLLICLLPPGLANTSELGLH